MHSLFKDVIAHGCFIINAHRSKIRIQIEKLRKGEMRMYTQEEEKALVAQLENILGTGPILYLKFCGEKKYAEDVVDGQLYSNPVKFFRDKERESGIRGQGDKNELINVIHAESVFIFDAETDDYLGTISNSQMKMNYPTDDNTPLVSFVGVFLHDMKLVDADLTHAEFMLPFTEHEFNEMQKSFGNYCVLIDPFELSKKIDLLNNALTEKCVFDQVRYVDRNCVEEIKAYLDGSVERFLYKDKDLSYQREYRLAVPMEMPNDHYIGVGKFDNATILDSSILKSLRLSIQYQSHVKKDPELCNDL